MRERGRGRRLPVGLAGRHDHRHPVQRVRSVGHRRHRHRQRLGTPDHRRRRPITGTGSARHHPDAVPGAPLRQGRPRGVERAHRRHHAPRGHRGSGGARDPGPGDPALGGAGGREGPSLRGQPGGLRRARRRHVRVRGRVRAAPAGADRDDGLAARPADPRWWRGRLRPLSPGGTASPGGAATPATTAPASPAATPTRHPPPRLADPAPRAPVTGTGDAWGCTRARG